MNKNAIVGIVAVGVLIAGGTALMTGGLSSGSDGGVIDGGKSDGGISTQPTFETPTEAQIVDKSVRSAGGRPVRVSGVSVPRDAKVKDSEIGRTVEVDSISPDSICNVLVETKEKKVKQGVNPINKKAVYSYVIDLPKEINEFVSQPVKVGTNIYMIQLKGNSCKAIGDFKGYLGSTMQEFLSLPTEKQKLFLKVMGTCPVDGGFVDCAVPVGDKKKKDGSKPFFPAQWAGREDLGFGQDESEK